MPELNRRVKLWPTLLLFKAHSQTSADCIEKFFGFAGLSIHNGMDLFNRQPPVIEVIKGLSLTGITGVTGPLKQAYRINGLQLQLSRIDRFPDQVEPFFPLSSIDCDQ